MNDHNQEAERAAFEAWVASKGDADIAWLEREKRHGFYINLTVSAWWSAWQAARCAPVVGESNSPEFDGIGADGLPAQGVKTWQERVEESGMRGIEHRCMLAEIADLRAQLARQSHAKPVLYQRRMRPTWERDGKGWTMWEECTKEAHDDCIRVAVLHDWQHEARALYIAPPLSSEQQAKKGEGNVG